MVTSIEYENVIVRSSVARQHEVAIITRCLPSMTSNRKNTKAKDLLGFKLVKLKHSFTTMRLNFYKVTEKRKSKRFVFIAQLYNHKLKFNLRT
jgi:hypothetical protein